MTAGGGGAGDPNFFLIFLLVGLKEACMLNFSFLGSYFTTIPGGWAGGRLEESKLMLTQPSLAGSWPELGNREIYASLEIFVKEMRFRRIFVKKNEIK
jgi:hypothetical protein